MVVYVRLMRQRQVLREMAVDDKVEIGREGLDPQEAASCPPRLPVADAENRVVPRRWFHVSIEDENTIRIENIHDRRDVVIAEPACRISPGESRLFGLKPETLVTLFPDHQLRILNREPSLIRASQLMPGALSHGAAPFSTGWRVGGTGLATAEADHEAGGLGLEPGSSFVFTSMSNGMYSPVEVVDLFRKAVQVVTEAAASDAYLDLAIRTAREMVRLDRCILFVPQKREDWFAKNDSTKPQEVFSSLQFDFKDLPEIFVAKDLSSVFGSSDMKLNQDVQVKWSPRGENWEPSIEQAQAPSVRSALLHKVWETKSTRFHTSTDADRYKGSRIAPDALAAPVIDRNGRIAAVLYGDRWTGEEGPQQRLGELEGLLFEVLAAAIAGGMARQAAERSQANLSEFFSPRVATMLVKRPEMLAGREAQVSVLFGDVRGFSAISEKFGPERTIALINDVLSELSQCVVDQDGVLVDYVGDELFAMWGAPEAQADHTTRVLAAASEMLRTIRKLGERWRSELQLDLDMGIGINSGPARVGNVGSRLKFKYGVLGNTVNLGSRLQGACKQLGVKCIVSAETVAGRSDRSHFRRLAHLKVVGIQRPVEVFEFVADPTPLWNGLRTEYEAALADYEANRPGETVRRLGMLLQNYPGDRPSGRLLAMAARRLTDPGDTFSAIWELEGK